MISDVCSAHNSFSAVCGCQQGYKMLGKQRWWVLSLSSQGARGFCIDPGGKYKVKRCHRRQKKKKMGQTSPTDQLHFPPSWPLLYLFLSIPQFLLPAHTVTGLHASTSTPSTRTLGFAPVSIKSQLSCLFLFFFFITVHELV